MEVAWLRGCTILLNSTHHQAGQNHRTFHQRIDQQMHFPVHEISTIHSLLKRQLNNILAQAVCLVAGTSLLHKKRMLQPDLYHWHSSLEARG